MNIIPTKKALSLFSSFSKSQMKLPNDCSLYSWHANYFTLNKKKILVLVNDKSFSPIVLADINVSNKKDLNGMIKLGIEEVFSYSNILPIQIKKYFLKASKLEITSNHNRSIIRIANNMIQRCQFNSKYIDFQTKLQPTIKNNLAKIPYRSQTPAYSMSIEIVDTELKKLI